MNSIDACFDADKLAWKISDLWLKWDQARAPWKADKQELRAYIFATDTRATTNGRLPWKNSTVSPKLTQIRDNLHANYLAALFPGDDWFLWESHEKQRDVAEKREAITAYMREKLKASDFQLLVSALVYDYIDYGNVFVTHQYVIEEQSRSLTYKGPRAYRVNPLDIVMNPIAENFSKAPFIRRVIKTIGDFQNDTKESTGTRYDKEVLAKALEMRRNFRADPEFKKNFSLEIDGFGSLEDYVDSDCIELLEYWGDIYDPDTEEYIRNAVITVVDRKWVIRKEVEINTLGKKPFYHCGWRLRPDNLWAQGPLDQLVGLQYRIDHLENLKADVFDMIAHPVIKVKGNTVEEFEYEPGATIFTGDEGDVDFMRPDTTALQADMQIQELMNRMEELAGAPRQAMGIRTPGEKTKYEVQQLENGAGRIFQSKVSWFEKNVLEPLLNGMLNDAIEMMDSPQRVRMVDPEYGTEMFMTVTKEDLMGAGRIFPVGARHFAEQAKFLQELNTTLQTVAALPNVAQHVSGKAVAKALEETLGWKRWGIVSENAAITEQMEAQRTAQQMQEEAMVASSIPVEGYEQTPTQ